MKKGKVSCAKLGLNFNSDYDSKESAKVALSTKNYKKFTDQRRMNNTFITWKSSTQITLTQQLLLVFIRQEMSLICCKER